MKLPVQIACFELAPSPDLELLIRQRASELDALSPDVLSCQVHLAPAPTWNGPGDALSVHIAVCVPEFRFTATSPVHAAPDGHCIDGEDAVHHAFDAMGRQLEAHARRRLGPRAA